MNDILLEKIIAKGGALPINKPSGITSFDVVARLRKLFKTKQVGHTGTLDPMASGVMVVLLGRAVKASELITADSKSYVAGLKLGVTSDTLDITGNTVMHSGEFESFPSEAEFENAVASFRGRIMQTPPMFSALKVGGIKLCDAARQGIEIEREAREIFINSISFKRQTEDEYILFVDCSKGTYIRSLCDDIGKVLGTGGVMSSLLRTRSGNFTLSECHTLEEIEGLEPIERAKLLIPIERLFDDMPAVRLPDFFERLARQGNPIYQKKIGMAYPEGALVRFYGKESFFALAKSTVSGGEAVLKPIKQFDI